MPDDFDSSTRAAKIAYIVFYALTGLALVSVLSGMVWPAKRADTEMAHSDTGAEEFVLSLYRKLDDGDYNTIAPRTIEGKWSKGKQPREYHFAGLLPTSALKEVMLDDYGENGWRIRFVTLKILGSDAPVAADKLDKTLKRESEIIRYIERLRGERLPVTVVTLTGHVTGRCHIIDWVRRLPLVKIDGDWVAISRGSPEDYEMVRREQWFTPVKF